MVVISQLLKEGQSRVDAWLAKALRDPAVFPYLSFEMRNPGLDVDGNDDWNFVFFMDDANQGVLRVCLDRGKGLNDMNVSLWVLSDPSSSKRRVAGQFFREVPMIAKRYGVRYVNASCHISNADSFKALCKRFGEPWGYQKDYAWNRATGAFENTAHFRCATSDFVDRSSR